jgi:hypothetical protein
MSISKSTQFWLGRYVVTVTADGESPVRGEGNHHLWQGSRSGTPRCFAEQTGLVSRHVG